MNSSAPSNNRAQQIPPCVCGHSNAWAFLEEGINHIMAKPQTGISYEILMGLYVVVYNYCSARRMLCAADTALGSGNHSKQAFLSAVAGSMSYPGS